MVSWVGSWLVAYAFNYFFEWSSAGDASSLVVLAAFRVPNSGTNQYIYQSAERARCVFHVLGHLLLRYTFHSEDGAGNQGAHTRGNRGIDDLIAHRETRSSTKHIRLLDLHDRENGVSRLLC